MFYLCYDILNTTTDIKKCKRKEDIGYFIQSIKKMTKDDEKIIILLRKICSRGNSAEVKQDKNGELKIYEVKKCIALRK